MTPKEKARDLFLKFYTVELDDLTHLSKEPAIECALECVDNIIDSYTPVNLYGGCEFSHNGLFLRYWEQVKQEIEKL
jgi:hypothetical protein